MPQPGGGVVGEAREGFWGRDVIRGLGGEVGAEGVFEAGETGGAVDCGGVGVGWRGWRDLRRVLRRVFCCGGGGHCEWIVGGLGVGCGGLFGEEGKGGQAVERDLRWRSVLLESRRVGGYAVYRGWESHGV